MRSNYKIIIMKLTHIFTFVVLLHLAIIGTLFVFPGCSFQEIRPVGDRYERSLGDPPRSDESTLSPASQMASEASSPDSEPRRLPPTRPTWNIARDEAPAVIEGSEDAAVETLEFNAINPDLISDDSIVMVEGDEGLEVEPVSTTYTVVKGDNLTKIARAKGVSLAELMAANDLDKNSVLGIGQVLVIPAAGDLAGPEVPQTPAVESVDSSIEGQSYTVSRGDTLGGIARRNGTTVPALRAANQLSGDVIYVGQTLVIPTGDEPVADVEVEPEPVNTRPGESTYVVRAGDTLGGIARRYNLTSRQLSERNNISDPRKLRAGATLVIPAEGASTAESGTTSSRQPAPRQPEISPVPAPSRPVAEETEVETEEFDFENLDDIPVVPVETSD